MSTVILHPTWKLLTKGSWPEKPTTCHGSDTSNCGEEPCICSIKFDEYHKALTEATSHLVDIAEEDWLELVLIITLGKVSNHSRPDDIYKDLIRSTKPDTPYSVDCEFEVIEEGITTKVTDSSANTIIRKIARLVMPKEVIKITLANGDKFEVEPPPETQDELWDEALRAFADNHMEAKKHFRIERI